MNDNAYKCFYFENKTPPYNKFWAVEVTQIEDGDWVLIRRWGGIGKEGMSMQEKFPAYASALRRKEKLIDEKVLKGYYPVM